MSEREQELERRVQMLENQLSETQDQLSHVRMQLAEGQDAYSQLRSQHDQLLERIALLTARKFCPSSETSGQLNLFDEAEVGVPTAEEIEEERQQEKADTGNKKKRRHTILSVPANTPTIVRFHALSDENKDCRRCGTTLEVTGTKTINRLVRIPATMVVVQDVYEQAACPSCEADTGSGETNLVTEPSTALLPSSMADSSLVASVVSRKFCDHLPLYRQSEMFSREVLPLSRQTLSSWVVEAGKALEPLGRSLGKAVLSSPMVGMDETRVQVLHEPGRKATDKSCMVVQVGTSKTRKAILFTYRTGNSGKELSPLIEGYRGILQTDGLQQYIPIGKGTGITHLLCWAHARRRFAEIVKANPKAQKAKKAVTLIGNLYHADNQVRERWLAGELDDEAFVEQRATAAREPLAELREFLDRNAGIPPKTELGKAFEYTTSHWDGLVRYCNHALARLDNNEVEAKIRPFSIGRSNWLFANTVNGAKASALLFSLVESAKANNINPEDYLYLVMEKAPGCTCEEDWEGLLPWNIPMEEARPLREFLLSAKPDPNRTEPYMLRGKSI